MNIPISNDRHESIVNTIKNINDNKQVISKYIDCDFINNLLLEMAHSDKREVDSQTKRLLSHMLKCKYQPSKFSRSWVNTVQDSSEVLSAICDESKSLKNYYVNRFNKNYMSAITFAHNETQIDINKFPEQCEWNEDDVLDELFISRFIEECSRNSTNSYY